METALRAIQSVRKWMGIATLMAGVLILVLMGVSALLNGIANILSGMAGHTSNVSSARWEPISLLFMFGYMVWKSSKSNARSKDWPLYLVEGLIVFVLIISAIIFIAIVLSMLFSSAAELTQLLAVKIQNDFYPFAKLITGIVFGIWLVAILITMWMAYAKAEYKQLAKLSWELAKEVFKESIGYLWEYFIKLHH